MKQDYKKLEIILQEKIWDKIKLPGQRDNIIYNRGFTTIEGLKIGSVKDSYYGY